MRFRFMILATAAFCPAIAHAQGGQDGNATAIHDIVVTANRVQSLASKTPITLTAIKGDDLVSQGVTNPTSLGEQVPNLSIDRNVTGGGLQITIRGVSSSDNTEKGDPSAAFMLDGIYLARPQAQEVSFFDIARVEVLRGPQGTLFGRNTTAGLVSLITNKPKLDEFSGRFDAAYGNYNNTQVTGVANLPIGQNVALRLAANWDHRDNFLKPGTGFTTSLNPFKENISLRATLLVDLGKGELLLRGDYSHMGGVATNGLWPDQFYSNYNTPGVRPGYVADRVSVDELLVKNLPYSDSLYRRNWTWGMQASLSYDFGPLTLNYDGSYRDFARHERDVAAVFGVLPIPVNTDAKFWQTSHELRLSTNGDGPLKAQAGLYYFKEHESDASLYIYGLLNPVPGATGYVFGYPTKYTNNESYAAFAQLTYSLTDKLRLTAGGRFTHDSKGRAGAQVVCGTVACDGQFDQIASNLAQRSYSQATWRGGLDYDLNDRSLLYAVVSTGYKAGGFNDGCEQGNGSTCTLTAAQLYYAPEKLTSYEAGIKTRLLDDAVSLNLAAFHYDYSNLQVSQAATCSGPCLITTNAGHAKIDGVEAEATIRPGRNFRFDGSFAYTNARYTQFVPLPGLDWAGKKLDRAPEIAVTAGATQTFPLGDGSNVEANVRTRLASSSVLGVSSSGIQFPVPAYTKTDAGLTYNAPNSRWYIQAYIKNIENSIVVSGASTGAFGTIYVSDPRTYGVRAGFSF